MLISVFIIAYIIQFVKHFSEISNKKFSELTLLYLKKFFDILDVLPHSFVGANADLLIAGGSALKPESVYMQHGHTKNELRKREQTASLKKHCTMLAF